MGASADCRAAACWGRPGAGWAICGAGAAGRRLRGLLGEGAAERDLLRLRLLRTRGDRGGRSDRRRSRSHRGRAARLRPLLRRLGPLLGAGRCRWRRGRGGGLRGEAQGLLGGDLGRGQGHAEGGGGRGRAPALLSRARGGRTERHGAVRLQGVRALGGLGAAEHHRALRGPGFLVGRRRDRRRTVRARRAPGVAAAGGAVARVRREGDPGVARVRAAWVEPQDTRRSLSPPKPVWRERSAPHAEAGSGRMPCRALPEAERAASPSGAGSSSKKCGPVSSMAPDGPEPDGGASGSPSEGAGRLVPGTQAAPFQYRTYPGMDGSG